MAKAKKRAKKTKKTAKAVKKKNVTKKTTKAVKKLTKKKKAVKKVKKTAKKSKVIKTKSKVKKKVNAKAKSKKKPVKAVAKKSALTARDKERAKLAKEKAKAKVLKERVRAKLAKEKDRAKAAKIKERAKLAKEKERARAAKAKDRAKIAKEKERAKLQAAKDRENAKLAKIREKEQIKAAKDKERMDAKRAKFKEVARIAKEKEKIRLKADKEKAKKEAAIAKAQARAAAKPPIPVLKIILCGPHSVYWIPRDTDIHSFHLEKGVHEEEYELANTIKAPVRKEEFIRARWLSRRILKYREPLLRKDSGEPTWPPDTIASISHKEGHVTFCTVQQETHYGLGIDIEKISKVKDGFESKICNSEESLIIDRVEALARMPRNEVLALIFGFKEAIYKAHYPLGKIHFNFHDVTITELAYERREIKARLNMTTSNRTKEGHLVQGFYNWVNHEGEKFVVSVAEERKPLVVDPEISGKASKAKNRNANNKSEPAASEEKKTLAEVSPPRPDAAHEPSMNQTD